MFHDSTCLKQNQSSTRHRPVCVSLADSLWPWFPSFRLRSLIKWRWGACQCYQVGRKPSSSLNLGILSCRRRKFSSLTREELRWPPSITSAPNLQLHPCGGKSQSLTSKSPAFSDFDLEHFNSRRFFWKSSLFMKTGHISSCYPSRGERDKTKCWIIQCFR